MKKIFYYIAIVSILFVLSGCSGSVSNMQVSKVDISNIAPKEGKAKVIFMRPSSFGFAIQSSVFTIKDNTPSIIGIVAAKKKLGQDFEAGEHLFMVIGESADFMSAILEADKTYYALVTPRFGVWKARFSLKPVSNLEYKSKEFNDWVTNSESVETNTDTEKWANDNRDSIYSKYTEYYKKWMTKHEIERPRLIDYIKN